jgi:hypothetical protein
MKSVHFSRLNFLLPLLLKLIWDGIKKEWSCSVLFRGSHAAESLCLMPFLQLKDVFFMFFYLSYSEWGKWSLLIIPGMVWYGPVYV